jgi:transposase InsO family protein
MALIEPGKPWQNGANESFNGKFRDECLVYQLKPFSKSPWYEKSRQVKACLFPSGNQAKYDGIPVRKSNSICPEIKRALLGPITN